MNATVKDVMTTHVVAIRMNASYKEVTKKWPPGCGSSG